MNHLEEVGFAGRYPVFGKEFTMRPTATALLLTAILPATALCLSNDWPQFRGPYRDGRSIERGLLSKWPEAGPTEVWSFQGLGTGFASVSVVDKTIYTTGMIDKQGWLFAVNAETGRLKWKKQYGPEWTGPHPGARTTPTIDGDRLYIMSGRGRIACYARETGDLVWKIDTLEKFNGKNITWGIAESVLVDANEVFCTPGGKDATMVALDKHTGRIIWTTRGLSSLSAYCSPIMPLGPGRILLTMVRGLFICVHADTGKVLWKIPHKTRNDIAAVTPLRYCGGQVYFTSHGTGGTKIHLKEKGAEYEQVWAGSELDSLHGGVIFDTAHHPSFYGSDSKENWVRQSIRTGQILFKEKLIEGKGSIIYADGMLYCYSEKGTLALVKPTKDGMQLISSFKIAKGDGMHWAHPAISHARLYIRHGDYLMAFDIKK